MERYRSSKHTTSSAPPLNLNEPKPNGSAGDPINDAPPITPELAKVSEALATFSTDSAKRPA